MKRASILAVCVLATLLGSCASSFEFDAEMIGGRLAFVPTGSGSSRPKCFYSVRVQALGGPHAKPEPGDDAEDVAGGIYWSYWKDTCENKFPLIYGQRLAGAPERDLRGVEMPHVRAKPLVANVIYYVGILSPGSNHGTAYFRLDGRGGVQNLTFEEVQNRP